jgi:hypothetical protein
LYQPTYLPHPTNPPPPPPFALTSIARTRDNLSSSELRGKLRNMETQGKRSLRTWRWKARELRNMETQAKRSFNMVAEVGAWK